MCPPGVDQTCRTTQQWHVLAPSCRQRQALGCTRGSDYLTPLKFLRRWDRMDFGALERLIRLPKTRSSSARSSAISDSQGSKASSSIIEGLPAEILGLVLAQDELEPKDVVSLGLCSTTLWSHSLSHINRETKLHLGSWAGQPLLCTGTYLTKLPARIYDLLPVEKDREDEYQTFMKDYYAGPFMPGRGRMGRGWYGPCPARAWNWNALLEPEDGGFEGVGGKHGMRMWTEALMSTLQASPFSVMLRARLWRDLVNNIEPARAVHDGLTIEQGSWILRNLTNKQYMRLDLQLTYQGHGPHAFVYGSRWVSLDQALIMRIAWNDSPEDELLDNELERICNKLGRGPWAGHSFDVVCADSQEHAAWVADGEDITDEILVMGERINDFVVKAEEEQAEMRREYWAGVEEREQQREREWEAAQ